MCLSAYCSRKLGNAFKGMSLDGDGGQEVVQCSLSTPPTLRVQPYVVLGNHVLTLGGNEDCSYTVTSFSEKLKLSK